MGYFNELNFGGGPGSPPRRIACFAIFLFLFFIPPPSEAREFSLEDWGCFVDLPQGWEPLEVTDHRATFADEGERAFFQIKTYPADQFDGGEEIFKEIGEKLKADGEGELFTYQGRESVFTDLLFTAAETVYRGFGVCIDGKSRDWAILSFAEAELAEGYHHPLLSALDSFSLNRGALLSPGPVSRFYEDSFEYPETFSFTVPFGKKDLEVMTSEAGWEASQIMLEREAKVLGIYTSKDIDAWQRFYRMIYRDNYRRMDTLYRSLLFNGFFPQREPRNTAESLLDWLQGFTYHRTGTSEDFSIPLETLYNVAGDCDSLGMVYVILLKHFGVDAILMVSDEYGHAMVGTDVPGGGARFSWDEKEWVVAEMTDQVELGQIAADVANPSGWLGISFFPVLP